MTPNTSKLACHSRPMEGFPAEISTGQLSEESATQQCEHLLRTGSASPRDLSRIALALEEWYDPMDEE